jgi:hypothetical protein
MNYIVVKNTGNYQVKIKNENNCYSDYSNQYNFYTSDILNSSLENEILISPNPAIDFLVIQIGEGNFSFRPEKIYIYNYLGELSFSINNSFTNGDLKIDISSLPSGIYFVKIGEKFTKFVKL